MIPTSRYGGHQGRLPPQLVINGDVRPCGDARNADGLGRATDNGGTPTAQHEETNTGQRDPYPWGTHAREVASLSLCSVLGHHGLPFCLCVEDRSHFCIGIAERVRYQVIPDFVVSVS